MIYVLFTLYYYTRLTCKLIDKLQQSVSSLYRLSDGVEWIEVSKNWIPIMIVSRPHPTFSVPLFWKDRTLKNEQGNSKPVRQALASVLPNVMILKTHHKTFLKFLISRFTSKHLRSVVFNKTLTLTNVTSSVCQYWYPL